MNDRAALISSSCNAEWLDNRTRSRNTQSLPDNLDNTMSISQKTPLYSLHLENGAKMVPFAGYEMPMQYQNGIIHEHLHTRSQAGLFDISHMGQIRISGDRVAAELEKLTPSDITGLKTGRQKYTVLTNTRGGIIDDLMVTNQGSSMLLIVNAACKDKDIAWLETHCSRQVTIENLGSHALLALQGPMSGKIMQKIAPEAAELSFLQARQVKIGNIPCGISRSGYTGEDGFEMSVGIDCVEQLARLFLDHEEVELIGLGARDTLRLEAGLCLYGHELDEKTTPIEAGLSWIIKPGHQNYPGAEKINSSITQQRIGVRASGKVPIREGTVLTDLAGNTVGTITSGSYGPTVSAPIAMGYINCAQAQIGNKLYAMVRSKQVPVTIVKLPFVPHHYHR
jgi:aminomethyltransferase